MTNRAINKTTDLIVKEHCINLPGERVQCWVNAGTDKLKIILRKHRDVVFDFHVNSGASYTLEATESDFYSVRDKKLIISARKDKINFADGESMHIWIGRNFRGALVVKSNGLIISRIIPSELDSHHYNDEPGTKPAPIIVAVNGKDTSSLSKKQQDINTYPMSLVDGPEIYKTIPNALPELDLPVVCVVDGTAKGMPTELVKYFENGGDHTGFADIDPSHVATRNWIWGQVAGSGAFIRDNWEWLRASIDGKTSRGFQLVKAKVHYVRGKVRFFFSGYSNSNTVFGRGGFSPGSDRIMTIFAGAGKTESAFAASVKGVAGTFKGNALVSFIFGSATAIIEWKADMQKDGYDLAAALLATTLKAILVAALVSVTVAALVYFGAVVFGATISVLAVGVLTVFVGVALSYLVDTADRSAGRALTHNRSTTDGVAAVFAPAMREAGHLIEKNWNYLMSKMAGDYQEIRFDNAI